MQLSRLASRAVLPAIAAALVASTAALGQSAQCSAGFDAMPLSTPFGLGMTFTPAAIGIPAYSMKTQQFWFPASSGPPTALYGNVFAGSSLMACGAGREMVVSSAALEFTAAVPNIAFTELRFGDYGNNTGQFVNISVNGAPVVIADNMAALHGLVISGVKIEVFGSAFGEGCGRVRLTKLTNFINKFQIGGQQFFVDCLTTQRPGDLTGDGIVNATDLAVVLANWGTHLGDVNGDQQTNATDLSIVLANWS